MKKNLVLFIFVSLALCSIVWSQGNAAPIAASDQAKNMAERALLRAADKISQLQNAIDKANQAGAAAGPSANLLTAQGYLTGAKEYFIKATAAFAGSAHAETYAAATSAYNEAIKGLDALNQEIKATVKPKPPTPSPTRPTATPKSCPNSNLVCTDQYKPVCGKDGKTYGNSCEAKRKCVEIASQGACKPTPKPTIKPTATPKPKPTAKPTATPCPNANTICTNQYEPVCGKDGKTYGNSCEAKRKCVEIASQGACKPTPKPTIKPTATPKPKPTAKPTATPKAGLPCGGFAGKMCPEGYICKLEGSYPDAAGVCVRGEIPKEEYCPMPNTNEKMSFSEAAKIAQESVCTKEGKLKDSHFCNANTGAWWIDLDIEKPGCFPACVINVSTKKTEINWRCTGLLNTQLNY